jgi:hypothetical protein
MAMAVDMRKTRKSVGEFSKSCSREDDDLMGLTLSIVETRRRVLDAKRRNDEKRYDELYSECAEGLLCWRLLAPDLMGPLFDAMAADVPETEPTNVGLREQLRFWLLWPNALLSPRLDNDRLLPIILPRALLNALLKALAALDHGETLPLLEPSRVGYHSKFSIVKERVLAWEFVYFLNGRGVPVGHAITQVEDAFRVPPGTFKDWRYNQLPRVYGKHTLKSMLKAARSAGAFDEERPKFGNTMMDYMAVLFWDSMALHRDRLASENMELARRRHWEAMHKAPHKR